MICKTCGKDRELSEFSVHKETKSGYDPSRCKPCKKAKWDWQQQPLNKRILNRVKARAKKTGREFELTLDDIVLPDLCPIFKRPFIYGDPDWTYSIDRIDNSKGYIKGNIVFVSNKANRLKNDASVEELQAIVDFYRACEVADFV